MIPVLLAAAAISAPQPAPELTPVALTAPMIIQDPDWVRTPTIDELVAAFPVAAIENGASGEALIECNVAAQGRLDRCFVLTERGGDYGFGQATVTLARHFRMAPRSLSGQPTEGATVRLPMVWKLN